MTRSDDLITTFHTARRQRILLLTAAAVAVVVCYYTFRTIGAGFPVPWWYYPADSWIFVGSVRRRTRWPVAGVAFWPCWIAVDLVGVPELLHFGYYPSAVYAVFVIWASWSGCESPAALQPPPNEAVRRCSGCSCRDGLGRRWRATVAV